MERIVWNKVLCQEVMKYGENMEKRISDISWRKFRRLYDIFYVEINTLIKACFTRKLQMLSLKYQNHNSILWWNIQKHNIPVDGIKVKFGAKVNSDQTWKVGRNQTIKLWKLEDLEGWKTEKFRKLNILKLKSWNLEFLSGNLENGKMSLTPGTFRF